MKRREVAALYQRHLSELQGRMELIERQKEKFVTDVYRIRTHPTLTEPNRSTVLSEFMNGRSYEEWMDYFDDHSEALKGESMEYQRQLHEYSRPQTNMWAGTLMVFVIIGALMGSVAFLHPPLTSFAIAGDHPIEPVVEKALEINESMHSGEKDKLEATRLQESS